MKRHLNFFHAPALCFLIGLTLPSVAEAQTPDDANAFIRAIAPGLSMHEMRAEWGNAAWAAEGKPIIEITTSDCAVQFDGASSGDSVYGSAVYGYAVDWSRVMSTSVDDRGYVLIHGGTQLTDRSRPIPAYAKSGLAVYLNTSQQATRLRNAFEVLRTACDRTRSLGF